MKIRDQIPQELIDSNEYLDSFITVLDGMNAYKEYQVDRHALFYKSLLIGDTSWLKKRLEDYGFPTIPDKLPKQCMDAMLINARNIMALKGSDVGLKFFLWSLTFGEISIDWTEFYPNVNNLTLSEFTGKGFLLADNPEEVDNVNYLLTNDSDLNSQILRIGIKSIYWENVHVIQYIKENITKFLNFTEDDFQLELVMVSGPYFRIPEPYWYFVNPIDYSVVNIDATFGIGRMVIEDTFIVT
jgi:hypothetical protein